MLKQTLFVAISLCAISHLRAGCFPGHFFVESGAASPNPNSKPYSADFPGVLFVGVGSPKNNAAQRRLSQVVAMMTVVTLAQTSDSEKGQSESHNVQVQG